MNKVNSFTFYKDYYNLIKVLPVKNRKEVLWAIMEYVFEDKEPSLDENSQAVFNTLSYQLNFSKKQATNGFKGGRPKKENPDKNPKGNPKGKPKYISSFLFLISNFKFNNNINKLLEEYLELRIKNKYTLTDSVVNRLCNKLNQYTNNDIEKEEIIMNAINGAWKDFYPLKESKAEQPKKKETQMEQLEREIRELEEQENEKTRGT